MIKDFNSWLNENFDTEIQSDELPGRHDYDAQQELHDFSKGITLTPHEVEEIKKMMQKGVQTLNPQQMMQQYDQAFLYKLEALGII